MVQKVSAQLLRQVRVVPLDESPATRNDPVDVLISDGQITQIGKNLKRPKGATSANLGGRWLIPGLWDQHVHFSQWVHRLSRFDLTHAVSAAHTTQLVAERIDAGFTPGPSGFLVGFGYRTGTWPAPGTVADLDAVTGGTPVVLISGDCHTGWLNSAALRQFGLPPRQTLMTEGEWFEIYTTLGERPGVPTETEAMVPEAVEQASRRGIVGIVDLEWARTWEQWQGRVAAGTRGLRVRTGVYADRLEEVIAAGTRSGDAWSDTDGLITMGSLKVITDGSITTRTAWCCDPYADVWADSDVGPDGAGIAGPFYGAPNQSVEELTDLVARAHGAGLTSALHAIGDRAVAEVLNVFEATGASGSIEHAQLVQADAIERWRPLAARVRASVQPAHLLDDREVTQQCWPDRTGRCFPLSEFQNAGIDMAFGSDAPVSDLDPWLAMSAAVHRGGLAEDAWHPEHALTPAQALAASVDGRRVAVGQPADLALLDWDPLLPGHAKGSNPDTVGQAATLRSMPVAATWLGGTVTWADSAVQQSLQ